MSRNKRKRSRKLFRSCDADTLKIEALEDRRMLAVFTVSSLNDAGAGSLREAIDMANASMGADDIEFSITGTINLDSQLPIVTDDLRITGPGQDNLTLDAGHGTDNIPATGDGFRIFEIDDSQLGRIDIAISGLTLTGGDTARGSEGILIDGQGGDGAGGGAILSHENLTINAVTITGNATGSGGNGTLVDQQHGGNGGNGGAGGGILSLTGSLSIIGSTIIGNRSGNGGNGADGGMGGNGGDGGDAGYGGGIAHLGSSLSITNSTISNNVSGGGGDGGEGGENGGNYGESGHGGDGGGVYGAGDVSVFGSTISDNRSGAGSYGVAVLPGIGGQGGGVYARGSVTITSSEVSGNRSSGYLSDGGGIKSATTVLVDSSVTGNSATGEYGSGGGIRSGNVLLTRSIVRENSTAGYFGFGGGISATSTTLVDSTVAGNSTDGGLSSGGGISGGNVTLIRSTVSGNSTTGFQSDGGGIRGSNVTLIQSTVSGNSTAGNDSHGGGVSSFGDIALSHSTVTDNYVANALGGGMWNQNDTVTINNSIVANNSASGGMDDIDPGTGALDVNFSLIGNASGLTISGVGNLTDVDPILGPLSDHGGPTQTHALLFDSPAIDAGDPSFTPPPDFDQRGAPFVRVFDHPAAPGTRIDMGAFEAQFFNNLAPLANAGGDVVATLGTSVVLDGTSSIDLDLLPVPLSFTWEVIDGPGLGMLADSDTATPTFTGDMVGVYAIQLTVNDGDKTDSDTVRIGFVPNIAPTADASRSQTSGEINIAIALDGSASSDADVDGLTYQWTVIDQPDGSSAMITADTAETTSIVADTVGRYTVQLIVNDGQENSEPATVDVFVFDSMANTPPFAIAKPTDVIIFVGESTALGASDSFDVDPGDSLTYAWSIVGSQLGGDGQLIDANSATTEFLATFIGEYVIQVVVNDGTQDALPVQVNVELRENHPPIARVSLSENSGVIGMPIRLNGLRSSDPNGRALSYRWSIVNQPDGSLAEIADPSSAVTSLSAYSTGSYRLQLIVNDGVQDSAPVFYLVNVTTGDAPTANVSLSANFGNTGDAMVLDGSRSTDLQDDMLTYEWSIIEQPDGSVASIINASAEVTTWSADTAGVYRIQLLVSDGTTFSRPVAFSAVLFDVDLPIPDVSLSQNAGFAGQPIRLDGSRSTDPQMSTLTYRWEIVLQPEGSNSVIADENLPTTTWTTDVAGLYRVRLDVSNGASNHRVTFMTNVSEIVRPVADVSLSVNTGVVGMDIALNGARSTDPDGLPLHYLWSVIARPEGSSVAIAVPLEPITTLNVDTAGEYRVRLIVTNHIQMSLPTTFIVSVSETLSFAPTRLDHLELTQPDGLSNEQDAVDHT